MSYGEFNNLDLCINYGFTIPCNVLDQVLKAHGWPIGNPLQLTREKKPIVEDEDIDVEILDIPNSAGGRAIAGFLQRCQEPLREKLIKAVVLFWRSINQCCLKRNAGK